MSKLSRYASILFLLVCLPVLTNAQCTVNAGTDYSRCVYGSDSIELFGNVAGDFTTYSWTSSGTGTLVHGNTLNLEYFHNQADLVNGSVTLTLTASGGTCGSVTDQITVTMYKLPTVVLENEFTICGTEISLTSTIADASTLQWNAMTGSGTFSSTTTANTIYSTSVADRARGYVFLSLNGSTPTSSCIGSDSVRVNIVSAASVNAGLDQTICSSANVLSVSSSSVVGYSSYNWTSSGTGYFIGPSAPAPIYIFSSADIAAGSVTLTVTGSSPTCGTLTDSQITTILPSPTVSAGGDQDICGNTALLNGTVTSASSTTLQWGNFIGDGTFSNSSILTPTYTMAATDKARGYVLVHLRATALNGCSSQDSVALRIPSAPVISAGSNKFSCSGSVTLTGFSFDRYSNAWTTSGTGTFSDANRDTTIYTPSTADRTSGLVTLTYSATNLCSTVSSTTKIDFMQSTQPSVNAGADAVVCGRDTIQLLGSVDNTTGGNWSTTGTGTFLASSSHLINQYILSTADKTAGTVVFTLTSYSNGGCNSVSGEKTVTITPGSLPYVNAGADQTSVISTPLNATVMSATSQLWQTSGTGLFVPNPTSVNSSYLPSADDITAGSVELTLVATGTCGNVADALTLFTVTPSSITGTVKAGSNTLDQGIVYLFVSTDAVPVRTLVAMDTLFLSDNGVYTFNSLPKGSYSVYAVPFTFSVYATSYLSTYYGSTSATEWQNAGLEEVANNSGSHVLNINLAAYTSAAPLWNTGHDTIAGAIFLNTPITASMRLASSNDVPFTGAVVYLKNLNGDVITYTTTDKNGVYTFNNVLQGNYLVDPEYSNTGTPFSNKIVAVDGNPQTIEDGSVFVNRTTLTTGVVSQNKSIQINAYPNPASDVIHIQLPKSGNYSVQVLDEVGGLHAEQEMSVTSGETVDLSLLSLHKGMYIIQITSGDEVYTTKVVKF